MKHRHFFIMVGSVSAAIGVAAGAFGAHGLKNVLSSEMLATYETAVRYQMYHAFGMIVAGMLTSNPRMKIWSHRAGMAFLLGTILFSGSLYALTISTERWFGAITPLGGVCFILGWLFLAVAAWRRVE